MAKMVADKQQLMKFKQKLGKWIESGKKLEVKPRLNRYNPLIDAYLKSIKLDIKDFLAMTVNLDGETAAEKKKARQRKYYEKRALRENGKYKPRIGNDKDIVITIGPKIMEYQIELLEGTRCIGCFAPILPTDITIDVSSARAHMNATCTEKAKKNVEQLKTYVRRAHKNGGVS